VRIYFPASLLVFFLFTMFYACKPKNGFTKIGKNARVKVIIAGDSISTPEEGDMVEFSFFWNDSISVEMIEEQKNEIGRDTVMIGQSEDDLYNVLKFLSVGDEAEFCMDATKILKRKGRFKPTQENGVSGKIVVHQIIRRFNLVSSRLFAEEQAIARTIQSEKNQWKVYANGIYVKIIEPGEGDTLKPGERVCVAYTGKYLNGVVFDDFEARSGCLEFTIGAQDQLIPGLEWAIRKFPDGSKLSLIIPYQEAFGTKGSTSGIVEPYKTLTFALFIKKINEPST
jgi:FKBP-type peptidyl-prolyl cis-trans isomerase